MYDINKKAFLTDVFSIQEAILNDGTKVTDIVIGAQQSYDSTFLEYMDGTIMADGHFADVGSSRFSSAYTAYPYKSCIKFQDDGNIGTCSLATVVCEKNLIEDAMMCINKADLDSVLTVNTSSVIGNIPSDFMSAQKCIQYCQGSGHAANASENKFVIVGHDECSCASGPLLVDLRQFLSDTEPWRWNRQCHKKPVGYTLIGNSDASTVAVYNADYSLRYHGEHLHSPSCWSYLNQFSMPAASIQRFNLQAEPGAPILTGVDCSATALHFCEAPLLVNSPAGTTFSGDYLVSSQYIPYRGRLSSGTHAYFRTALSRQEMKVDGKKYQMCGEASECLLKDIVDPVKGMELKENVSLTIKLPKVFKCYKKSKFAIENAQYFQEMLLTGIWWTTHLKTSYSAYISSISKIDYNVKGVSISSLVLEDHIMNYTNTVEAGENMVRFPQPIFTDEIKLSGFYANSDWNIWNYGHNVYFNMELYGCADYDIEEVHCADGWFSTKTDCQRIIESPDAISFDEAAAKCEELGAKLLEPMNELLQSDMETLLTSYTGSETSFWIGII